MICPHCRQPVPCIVPGMSWYRLPTARRLAQLHAAGQCRRANVSGSLQQRLNRSISEPWPADPAAGRRDAGGRFTKA